MEKEKERLKEKRAGIKSQLQFSYQEKERKMAEMAEIDGKIKQKQMERKKMPLWKAAPKQELNEKIDNLNIQKSYLASEIEKLDSNINSLDCEKNNIDKKLPLIMTKKEKARQEKKALEDLLNGSSPCYWQGSNALYGATEETRRKAKAIAAILTFTPKTADEINDELGTEYTALQIANAVKHIEDAYSKKVIREKTNSQGQKIKKEYTAYFLYYGS